MRFKVLNENIRKNGFDYHLEWRTDKWCIYRQQSGEKVVAYEVFKVKHNNPHPKSEQDCKNFDLVESFPCDEDFGKRAWTYRTLEKALEKSKRMTTDDLRQANGC